MSGTDAPKEQTGVCTPAISRSLWLSPSGWLDDRGARLFAEMLRLPLLPQRIRLVKNQRAPVVGIEHRGHQVAGITAGAIDGCGALRPIGPFHIAGAGVGITVLIHVAP